MGRGRIVSLSEDEFGATGAYFVVAELLKRGLKPYVPAVDTGIDILLEGGKTIQVKASRKSEVDQYGYHYFRMDLLKDKVDFVILCAFDYEGEEIAFFIIPSTFVQKQTKSMISLTPNGKYSRFKDAWHLLEDKNLFTKKD